MSSGTYDVLGIEPGTIPFILPIAFQSILSAYVLFIFRSLHMNFRQFGPQSGHVIQKKLKFLTKSKE